jgi:hypothetical protein
VGEIFGPVGEKNREDFGSPSKDCWKARYPGFSGVSRGKKLRRETTREPDS